MKKSINIGLIIFLLLQACSGTENIENQPQDKETSKNNQKETELRKIKETILNQIMILFQHKIKSTTYCQSFQMVFFITCLKRNNNV